MQLRLEKKLVEQEKKLVEHRFRCSANKSSFTFCYVIDIMGWLLRLLLACDDARCISTNHPSMGIHVKFIIPWVIGAVVLSVACVFVTRLVIHVTRIVFE